MKILIIDRDRTNVETIEKSVEDIENIDITIEPTKSNIVNLVKNDHYDLVLIDPAPQNNELRAIIIQIKRNVSIFTPIILMARQDIKKSGAIDYLPKPFEPSALIKKIENVRNFSEFNKRLNDNTDDYRSADGLISKSAFNQIFLCALDRHDRYDERTFLMFTRIENLDDIIAQHGDEVANELCEQLKTYTMKTRRLSDIAARTAKNEMCLMLIRPQSDDEPSLAVSRLVESIEGCYNLISANNVQPNISVSMMAIPSGEMLHHQTYMADID